jgi:hypothetical protein
LIETLAPSPTTIEVKPGEQKSDEPTLEQTAIIADLHWLVHQGHVLEFADGKLDTAKKPSPRPPKPEKKKPAAEGEVAVSTESGPQAEVAIEPVAETSVLAEAEIPAPEPASVIEPVPADEQPNQIASEPPVS